MSLQTAVLAKEIAEMIRIYCSPEHPDVFESKLEMLLRMFADSVKQDAIEP